jgi:hypothetical protein
VNHLPAAASTLLLPHGSQAHRREGRRWIRRSDLYSCRLGVVFVARFCPALALSLATRVPALNKLASDPLQLRRPTLWLESDLRASFPCVVAVAATVIPPVDFVLRLGRRSRARSRVTTETRRSCTGAGLAADDLPGVAVDELEAPVDPVLGLWSKVGGAVCVSRLCRLDRAMRQSGRARGLPRPTFSKASVLVVRRGRQ